MKSWIAAFLIALGSNATAFAGSGRELYLLHCWGCHGENGQGIRGSVPPITHSAGYFVHTPEGRAYLIEVPGVAGARLNDEELAEVVNWTLEHFSRDELPRNFAPYTAHEVAIYRSRQPANLFKTRAWVADQLRKKGLAVPDLDPGITPRDPQTHSKAPSEERNNGHG